MSIKTSVKLSNVGIDFLKKLRTNRRKMDVDEEDLSYWKLIEVIARHFRNRNDEYLELVKLPEEKNA